MAAFERRELEAIPDSIVEAEARVEALQERLADPATYQDDGDVVAALRSELGDAEAEVDRLTARWEELEERQAASQG